MMKIVYYEMRKSWLKISTFAVLFVLTGLNYIQSNGACQTLYPKTYGDRKEAYFRLYETVCGTLTEDKIAPFRQRAKELENEVSDMVFSREYNPAEYITGYIFGDFNLYNLDIGSEISYCATYPNISDKITSNAAECYNFYKSVGNSYEAEKFLTIYRMYQGRKIPEYRATYWTNLFFNHDFSSLLCLIMLILCLSSSFTGEKSSGMNTLISAYGKSRSAVFAKVISSAVFCAFLTIYFSLCDLVNTHFLLGVDGLDMPIYSAEMFQNSPFSFSFTAAIFVTAATRFLALFTVSLLIIFLSKISPNTIISMALSFGALLAMIILTSFSKSVINPINSLSQAAFLEDFSAINLCGQPVLALFAAIIFMAAECIILCGIIAINGKSDRR